MSEEQPLKRSNFVALLWSIAQPGLGHLYLGNKIMGFAFIIIGIFVVVRTKLNEGIFFVFSGNFKKAI
jgi:hypothetical protein